MNRQAAGRGGAGQRRASGFGLALIAGAACLAGIAPAVAQSEASGAVRDLGTLPGFDGSHAFAISGDASTVVGAAFGEDSTHAVRWTAAGAITDLAPDGRESTAFGVNFNGSVIVGSALVQACDCGAFFTHAFVWTNGTGRDIGTLEGAQGYSQAFGVSGDGKVVVGESSTEYSGGDVTYIHAFKWTKTGGLVDLGTLSGDSGFSSAAGTNSDGSLIVGTSSRRSGTSSDRHAASGTSGYRAVYWTGPGPIALPSLASGTGDSFGKAVNADGTVRDAVIVGSSDAGGAQHATAWRLTESSARVRDLGVLNDVEGGFSVAQAVNANGAVIVGTSEFQHADGPTHAFRWTEATGLRDLNTLLANAGVNMNGVDLKDARGVSANGQFIVGSGTFDDNRFQTGYIARYVDATIAGVTTPDSIVRSVQNLANDRETQIVTTRVLSSVLLGANEQIKCGSCVSAFGSVGSFSAGAHGRYNVTDSFTILGGFAFTRFKDDTVDVRGAPIFALALRYDPADWGPSRPFGEIGAVASPWQSVRYTRVYANGAGTAKGIADTDVATYAAFARLGWLFRFSPIDEFAVAGEIWRGWQRVKGYSEAMSNLNPFEATVGTGTDRLNIVKGGAQYTHLFGSSIETTVNVGVAHSFAARSGVRVIVDGFGGVPVPNLEDRTWFEYGLRVGYRLTQAAVVDLFVDGAAGPEPIGSEVHGGIGFRYNF